MRATLNLHKTKRICKYQQQIDEIDNYKNRGTIIRSKEKIVLNEEKPTKYFFSQEKQKQNKKHITCLKNDTGKLLKKNSEILKECTKFYQTLYTKQNTWQTMQNKLLENILPKVSESQNLKLSQKIQITEM